MGKPGSARTDGGPGQGGAGSGAAAGDSPDLVEEIASELDQERFGIRFAEIAARVSQNMSVWVPIDGDMGSRAP